MVLYLEKMRILSINLQQGGKLLKVGKAKFLNQMEFQPYATCAGNVDIDASSKE
jgi:hypothetical protein